MAETAYAKKHPADMTPEEFFAMPEVPTEEYPALQPLRHRHDSLGWADERGRWWTWAVLSDGSWARQAVN